MKMKATGLGRRIHGLRQKEGLTQAALATRLGISASYLNLIENDRRPLSANLLLALARAFDMDLRAFAPGEDANVVADLAAPRVSIADGAYFKGSVDMAGRKDGDR